MILPLLLASAIKAQQEALTPCQVKVAYVIPADRKPQPEYEARIRMLIKLVRNFYSDELERQGFGRKTFNIETNRNGHLPIHLINSKLTANEFAGPGDIGYEGGAFVDHSQQALAMAGFEPHASRTIWLTLVEAQYQALDGSIKNDTAQADGVYGSGNALCTGLPIAMSQPQIFGDHRPYDGITIPDLGPYKLKKNVSFPYYQGTGVSSLAGDFISAVAHELGHSFLLQHTYLNDTDQNGNLMGNGFRGWRGYQFPAAFPDEDLRLSRPSALILNLCPFFNPKPIRLSTSAPPTINLLTQPGKMVLDHGSTNFAFSADQDHGPGIALATLENGTGKNGVGVVAWHEFQASPSHVLFTFTTSRIVPNREDAWRLRVFDRAGNFTEQMITLTASANGIGPQTSIFVGHTTHSLTDNIEFKGSATGIGSKFRWDFGDGAQAEGMNAIHRYAKAGLYEVKLTATGAANNTGTISQFIRIR